jgi:hypothetical protein
MRRVGGIVPSPSRGGRGPRLVWTNLDNYQHQRAAQKSAKILAVQCRFYIFSFHQNAQYGYPMSEELPTKLADGRRVNELEWQGAKMLVSADN